MEECVRDFGAGRWAEARGNLGRILQMEPSHADALYLRSALALRTGDFAAAAAGVEKLLAQSPTRARAAELLELKGFSLLGLGHVAAGIEAFRDMFAANAEYQEDKAKAYLRRVSPLDRSLYWTAPASLFNGPRDAPSVFTCIYERGVWGGGSGAGSNIEHTAVYAGLVQYLIASRSVRSIVDLGCGDWRFSRYLDFTGVDYLGVDVVPAVIEANNAQFASTGIRFECADVAAFPLPECDLVLCKDVLQHLSNANVLRVCSRLAQGRCWLLTNDFHSANEDCANGDTRPLDPTSAPFFVAARPVLTFNRKVAFLVEQQVR
jgi:2-polyprenyl-3-methyl-5-hydroxy-6-metoxy-1,4-benzoquinol methylase